MERCQVEGCLNPRKTRGYCNKHYIQVRRHHRLMLDREYGPRGLHTVCIVPDCQGKHRAHGYCGKHYRQIRIYGRLTPEREYRTRRCSVPDCEGLHYVKGYCQTHYEHLIKPTLPPSEKVASAL